MKRTFETISWAFRTKPERERLISSMRSIRLLLLRNRVHRHLNPLSNPSIRQPMLHRTTIQWLLTRQGDTKEAIALHNQVKSLESHLTSHKTVIVTQYMDSQTSILAGLCHPPIRNRHIIRVPKSRISLLTRRLPCPAQIRIDQMRPRRIQHPNSVVQTG
jgi:hypothetical protein